jgi:hypothetical protein
MVQTYASTKQIEILQNEIPIALDRSLLVLRQATSFLKALEPVVIIVPLEQVPGMLILAR